MVDRYDPAETTMADLLPADTLAYFADEPIDVHTWFELSYANYAVLNRTVLQSMPLDWQHRFTTCMRELETVIEGAGIKTAGTFDVQAVEVGGSYDDDGEYVQERIPVADPIPHYNRGRELLDLRPQADA